jgi:pilus assembly protein CpaB
MVNRRYTLVFYAAIVTALAATFGVWRALSAARAQSRIATAPVLVATRDLPEGTALAVTDVAVSQWPVTTIPAGAFGQPDSVAGRVTRVAVFKGEVIVPGRLAPEGTGPGIEVKITPGKRAMAVPINDVSGIAGLIQPNSRVDVMVTLQDDTRPQKERVAKMFMSNMRVLSVGTRVERGEDGKPINATTVALEVSPTEAERLAVAVNQGMIQLVLRGYGDPDSIKTRGAVSTDVLAQLRDMPAVARPQPEPAPRPAARRAPAQPVRVIVQRAPAAAPAPAPAAPRQPQEWTVEINRGSTVSQQKFVKPDSSPTP